MSLHPTESPLRQHGLTFLAVLLLTMASSACQTTYQNLTAGDPVARIASVTLHHALTVPPETASVFLQYGQVHPERHVDVYYPNCVFEVRDVSTSAQTIEPGEFKVQRIGFWEDYAVSRSTMFASVTIAFGGGLTMGGGGGNGNGPSYENYATVIDLHSNEQPQVMRLTCQHWEDPTEAEHVTLEQIRKAVGEIVSLGLR